MLDGARQCVRGIVLIGPNARSDPLDVGKIHSPWQCHREQAQIAYTVNAALAGGLAPRHPWRSVSLLKRATRAESSLVLPGSAGWRERYEIEASLTSWPRSVTRGNAAGIAAHAYARADPLEPQQLDACLATCKDWRCADLDLRRRGHGVASFGQSTRRGSDPLWSFLNNCATTKPPR